MCALYRDTAGPNACITPSYNQYSSSPLSQVFLKCAFFYCSALKPENPQFLCEKGKKKHSSKMQSGFMSTTLELTLWVEESWKFTFTTAFHEQLATGYFLICLYFFFLFFRSIASFYISNQISFSKYHPPSRIFEPLSPLTVWSLKVGS